LGIIYVAVIAEGLRRLVPPLSQKLYKLLPGLGALKNYEATYRLDLAPFLSVIILMAVRYTSDAPLSMRSTRAAERPSHPG
jgi:hypothetical protein